MKKFKEAEVCDLYGFAYSNRPQVFSYQKVPHKYLTCLFSFVFFRNPLLAPFTYYISSW